VGADSIDEKAMVPVVVAAERRMKNTLHLQRIIEFSEATFR
jgi:hypothetical protein